MKFKHLLSMILVSTTLLVGCQSSKGTEVEEQIPVVDETSSSTKQEEETTDVEKEVEEILKINPLMDETRIQEIVQQINLRIGKVIDRKKQLEKC